MLASGLEDSTVRIWDVETREQIKKLEGYRKPVVSVSWSPDGKRLASGSDYAVVIIWQLFNDEIMTILNKVFDKNKEGNQRTQLTFEQALGLIAAINAKKNGKEFEFEKITDQVLIDLIKQCSIKS